MSGAKLNVRVDVYVGDNLLKKRDFDTEYDYIPKSIIYTDDTADGNINVLNYLMDDKCIDLVPMNKYSQPTCHWSLCDCNDYIFNLYDGFSGCSVSNGHIIQSSHHYGRTPAFDTRQHNEFTNNVGWLNMSTFDDWQEFYIFISYLSDNQHMMSVFFDNSFVNDVKYKNLPNTPIYFYGVHTNSKLYPKIVNNFEHTKIGGNLIVIVNKNTLIFVSDNLNDFTHRSVMDYFTVGKFDNELLNSFISVFKSFVPPSVISLSSSLVAQRCDGPTYNTDEFEYYKDDKTSNYVIRYDGKIKPTFTTSRTLYYKDYLSDDRTDGYSRLQSSIYGQYVSTGYEPLYKSIDYCSIKSTNMTYDSIPNIEVGEFDDNIPLICSTEYNWFNNGIILCVNPSHNVVLRKHKDEDINDVILQYLSGVYGEEYSSYIKSLYTISYDWDYDSISDIDTYKYNITMKLK
jgi:hypothetical protein